jgi:hypothetical protein
VIRLTTEYFYLEPNVWYVLIADAIDMGQTPVQKEDECGPFDYDGNLLDIEDVNGRLFVCKTVNGLAVYKVKKKNNKGEFFKVRSFYNGS